MVDSLSDQVYGQGRHVWLTHPSPPHLQPTHSMNHQPFILAHISDLHLKTSGKLAYGRVDTTAALKRCVGVLNAFTPAIDAVLISGDLTDFGRPEEYQALRAQLNHLTMPYYVITGNHDRREAMREAFADHAYLPKQGKLNWCVNLTSLTLVGLDALVEGQSAGVLCGDTLAWLQQQLQHTQAQHTQPVFIACHQPPIFTGIAHMDQQNLQNSDALAAIIRPHHHVQRILCGHVHRYVSSLWAGTLLNIAPGVSHQVSLNLHANAEPSFCLEPPGMLIHLIYGQQVTTHYHPIIASNPRYPFFHSDGSLLV